MLDHVFARINHPYPDAVTILSREGANENQTFTADEIMAAMQERDRLKAILADPDLLRLSERDIQWQVADQERNLAADDPAGCCAAYHRGAIWAFNLVIERGRDAANVERK